MPDLDIIARSPAPGWRTPFRLLRGNGTHEEVAAAVLKSLSRSLRQGGGLPGLGMFVDVVSRYSRGQISLPEALDHLRSIERAELGHPYTRIASRSTAQLLQQIRCGECLDQDWKQLVAERFCWAMTEHALFSRAQPDLIGERFPNYAEARGWNDQCKEILRPGVKKVAGSLVLQPSGSGLRAPRMPKMTSRSTAAMLYEPLEL